MSRAATRLSAESNAMSWMVSRRRDLMGSGSVSEFISRREVYRQREGVMEKIEKRTDETRLRSWVVWL